MGSPTRYHEGMRSGAIRSGPAWFLTCALLVIPGRCSNGVLSFAAPGSTEGTPAAVPLGRAGCVPDCRGKGCGTDGCGGHCGKCAQGELCLAARCVKNTTVALCRLVAGHWKGAMHARPVHHLEGRIFLKGKACRGRLKVSYNLRRKGRAWVVQEFVVTFTGTHMRMRGVRLSAKSSNSNYNLDRFSGRLDRKLKRFSGRNRDVRGSVSHFVLTRK